MGMVSAGLPALAVEQNPVAFDLRRRHLDPRAVRQSDGLDLLLEQAR
jgi:hypothetical protein